MGNKAPWVKAFPKQARALRPERSKAGGIKSRSQSEEVRMAVYRPIANLFKAAYPRCQCHTMIAALECQVADRSPETEDIHHRFGREGLLLFDIRFFIACCRKCHDWIHANPKTAELVGLLGD